jgi:AcrR family transcriptional regulator
VPAKGNRSQPTRARLIEAALALLGRDEYLVDLGLRREHVAQEAGYARNTLDYHFPTAPSLVEELIAEHRRHMLAYVGQQAGRYELSHEVAATVGPEALREALRAALHDDLPMYLPAGDDPVAVGRERLYWLCVALADRTPLPGSPDVRALVAETNRQTQQHFAETYRVFLDLMGREPISGTSDEDCARVQRLVKCFLEGNIVHRRLGMPVHDDDAIDGVLGLIVGLTRPTADSA